MPISGPNWVESLSLLLLRVASSSWLCFQTACIFLWILSSAFSARHCSVQCGLYFCCSKFHEVIMSMSPPVNKLYDIGKTEYSKWRQDMWSNQRYSLNAFDMFGCYPHLLRHLWNPWSLDFIPGEWFLCNCSWYHIQPTSSYAWLSLHPQSNCLKEWRTEDVMIGVYLRLHALASTVIFRTTFSLIKSSICVEGLSPLGNYLILGSLHVPCPLKISCMWDLPWRWHLCLDLLF